MSEKKNEIKVSNTKEEIDYQELIKGMQLTSDIFFCLAMDDISVCEEFIQIITNMKVEISELKYQHAILNLAKHSIVMDIYGKLINHKRFNLEMHPQSGEDRVKRIRYNIASIDVDNLKKGEVYKETDDVYAIYITKADFLKTKRVVNHVIRTIEDTDIEAVNGIHEYYVVLSGKSGTAAQLALMSYIQNSNGIMDSKYFPKLVSRVRFLKEGQGGKEIMCEIFDAAVNKAAEKVALEMVREEMVLIEKKIEEEKAAMEEEKVAMEKRGEKRGILGAIDIMRTLGLVDDAIETKLVEKFSLSQEIARGYLAISTNTL